LNVNNKDQKLLPININVENLSNNVEDDGLSSQNESDESQDRFSYKEFDSGGNSKTLIFLHFYNIYIYILIISTYLCYNYNSKKPYC